MKTNEIHNQIIKPCVATELTKFELFSRQTIKLRQSRRCWKSGLGRPPTQPWFHSSIFPADVTWRWLATQSSLLWKPLWNVWRAHGARKLGVIRKRMNEWEWVKHALAATHALVSKDTTAGDGNRWGGRPSIDWVKVFCKLVTQWKTCNRHNVFLSKFR